MNPLLIVWNLQEDAVKPFTNCYKEIFMVLETSGGCCESIIDGLNLEEVAVKPFAHFTKKYLWF